MKVNEIRSKRREIIKILRTCFRWAPAIAILDEMLLAPN